MFLELYDNPQGILAMKKYLNCPALVLVPDYFQLLNPQSD